MKLSIKEDFETQFFDVTYVGNKESDPESTYILRELRDVALSIGCSIKDDIKNYKLTILADDYAIKDINKAFEYLMKSYNQPFAVRKQKVTPHVFEESLSKLHEGDYELFSEPEYIGPYGDDGWETDDDDYYNFKQLGLRTVQDVVDFYKRLSKRQIVARRGAYGVLGDIDWNVRHGYWDDADTQVVIDALDSDPSFKFYGESIKRNKSKRLREQDVEIEVKHEGILEVPDGKNVDDLPLSHFEKLAKKKGLGKITKALNNLQVWNKNDDPKLSKWAGDMIDKLNKKLKKDESISRNRFNEGWHNGDAIITFIHNDDLEADLEEFLFDLFSDNPDVFDFDWLGKNTTLYLACSEDDYKYIEWFIEDWKYKHRDEYDESLKEYYIGSEYGEYFDEHSLRQRYNTMMMSGQLDDIINLYHDLGGDFDEFAIEATERGFSKIDIFTVGLCVEGIPVKEIEKRLRMMHLMDESVSKRMNKSHRWKNIRTERYIGKYYWSYRYDHPFIDRINNSGSYFTDANIRNIPLLARDNPDDCYSDDPWRIAVEDRDYNGQPLYCTEDQAYKRLKDYLNSTMYERRNDL